MHSNSLLSIHSGFQIAANNNNGAAYSGSNAGNNANPRLPSTSTQASSIKKPMLRRQISAEDVVPTEIFYVKSLEKVFF